MKPRKPERGKIVVEEYSSAPTMNTSSSTLPAPVRKTTCTKTGGPSKSSISRQKRRKTRVIKKKLQELRSIVPKITKMDTADSIIGEAALYAIELETRARMLRAQMERIEVSEVDKPELERLCRTVQQVNSDSASKNIAKMEVVQVGERGLVKLVCNKGKGVAVSLYEALESDLTTGWDVESSILNTVAENFELKFTLNVGKLVNLENLKKWVAGAFLKQGFDFIASPQP